MFGLGAPELVLVVFILILLFGAARLPKLGRALGQTIADFREGIGSHAKDDRP